MLLPQRILVSLLFPLIIPCFARSQGPIAAPSSTPESVRGYQNSPDGLRWQLQDLLNAARDHSRSRLESLVRQTEIPDYKEWFAKTFGRQKGESWAGAYGRNLTENEKYLEDVLTQLASEDGEFLTRNVNDDPAPARTVEADMVEALQRPVDIHFASWKIRGSQKGSSPIGYFVFLEGRFRLDSAISSMEVQPDPGTDTANQKDVSAARVADVPNNPPPTGVGNSAFRPGVGGIGYPSCDYCPDPPYTKLAREKKLQGTVVLQAIIQADGEVTDVNVVKSPSPELAEMAIGGVSKWHMNPARRADGEPVPVLVPIEVTFRLAK